MNRSFSDVCDGSIKLRKRFNRKWFRFQGNLFPFWEDNLSGKERAV